MSIGIFLFGIKDLSAILKIRDRLGCPSVDTPACPRIFMLLGAGAPA